LNVKSKRPLRITVSNQACFPKMAGCEFQEVSHFSKERKNRCDEPQTRAASRRLNFPITRFLKSADEKFQFSRFIAAGGQTQEIVPFHKEGGTAQHVRKPGEFFNRGLTLGVAPARKSCQIHNIDSLVCARLTDFSCPVNTFCWQGSFPYRCIVGKASSYQKLCQYGCRVLDKIYDKIYIDIFFRPVYTGNETLFSDYKEPETIFSVRSFQYPPGQVMRDYIYVFLAAPESRKSFHQACLINHLT